MPCELDLELAQVHQRDRLEPLQADLAGEGQAAPSQLHRQLGVSVVVFDDAETAQRLRLEQSPTAGSCSPEVLLEQRAGTRPVPALARSHRHPVSEVNDSPLVAELLVELEALLVVLHRLVKVADQLVHAAEVSKHPRTQVEAKLAGAREQLGEPPHALGRHLRPEYVERHGEVNSELGVG